MEKRAFDCTVWTIDERMMFCGCQDVNLDLMRDRLSIDIILQDNAFEMIGETKSLNAAEKVLKTAFEIMQTQKQLSKTDVLYLIQLFIKHPKMKVPHFSREVIVKTISGKLIYPKTIGQHLLIRSMEKNDITFASGVAGTGKTYLAVLYGISQLKKGNFNRIILTRPAVEAGESLGFLPGDLKEKVDPYLRPLYDALYDVLGNEQVAKLLEKEVIEIAPLAYMRGRTLDHAFIILDEAQNTTSSQMKMFLTRMGFNSKIVITGDSSQIDLVKKSESGLTQAIELLHDIEGIGCVELTSMDVVRHPLVQKIIDAYEKY